MKPKPLKTEVHHWWPRTLSDHWSAADGMVSVILPTGEVRRAPPGTFGAITNAHHVKPGGPWNSTFEPLFDQADNEMSEFVRWLSTIETSIVGTDRSMLERIAPQQLAVDRLRQISRITASLLARSPSIRHSIKLITESYRRDFGLSDPSANKTLIAANQRGLYDAYRKKMEGGGRWAILCSGEKEFIAGDGFLHNFPASQDGINSGKKLVLPILPTATIVYMLPMEYPSEPRLVTLRVGADEVAAFNAIVQVYSNNFIFFRDEQPKLNDSFRLGQHQIFEHHGHEWLDSLLDDLSQYNRWGKGGAASFCRRRPYTESLENNRWLTALSERHTAGLPKMLRT